MNQIFHQPRACVAGLGFLLIGNAYSCDKASVEAALAIGVSLDKIMASAECAAAVAKATESPPKKAPEKVAKAAPAAAPKKETGSADKPKTPAADGKSADADSGQQTAAAGDPKKKEGEDSIETPDDKKDKNVFDGTPPTAMNGKIKAKVYIPGFQLANQAKDDDNPKLYAPPGSVFKITREEIASKPKEDGKIVTNLYGRFTKGIEPTEKGFIERENDDNIAKGIEHFAIGSNKNTDDNVREFPTRKVTGGPAAISFDEEYVVDKDNLKDNDHKHNGWTYGLLMAPYKMHLSDRSISSSTSLGPYIGYETESSFWTAKFIGSIGYTSIPVATVQADGSSKTDNKSGVSLSFGMLWELNNEFGLGVLIGSDNLGPNSGYKYNGKPWLAIDIGYKFSN